MVINNNFSTEDICPIVVTYNPGSYFERNMVALSAQTSNVLIVDNASQDTGFDIVKLAAEKIGAHLIINKSNLGIAGALNQGVRYAINNGYRWIATFDQDSLISQSYFANLLRAAKAATALGRVGLVAPYYIDERTGFVSRMAYKYQTTADGITLGLAVPTITSGNLIPVQTFEVVGYFDESLFIDCVDYDFCFRCVAEGLLVLEAGKVSLNHNGGCATLHKFKGLKRPMRVSNHSAFRRYFIARNRIIIYRKYLACHASWCLHDMEGFCHEVLKIILYEKNKRSKLINTVRGLLHGLTRRTGPAPTDLAEG